jgi:PIN domain nuclease of toxin-antitoxin system
MAIKSSLGKLTLGGPFTTVIPDALRRNGFLPLPIEFAHLAALHELPHHHRDPFDRLILSQAIAERVPVLSADAAYGQYAAQIIW